MRSIETMSGFGPGKVILLGEHGVVYGHPALAAPLSVGVTAEGRPAKDAAVRIPSELKGESRRLLRDAFAAAVQASAAPPLQVTIRSELPPSMGLGSSAAVSVACARLLLKASLGGAEAAAKDVARVAWEMEKVFHGTPSGVDHTTSAEAAMIHFRRKPGTEKAKVLKVRSPRPLGLVVALIGKRPATKATVAALRERQAKWPERYARIFKDIGAIVDEGRVAVERGDAELLGDLMNMNQGLLAALGLSSPGIEAMAYRLREAGALGAKLTGAGGDGGAVIALFEDARRAAKSLKRAGIRCFASEIASAEES